MYGGNIARLGAQNSNRLFEGYRSPEPPVLHNLLCVLCMYNMYLCVCAAAERVDMLMTV